jgi:hypothetical protein
LTSIRDAVEAEIADMYMRYEEANAARNPFRNFEYYAIPLTVGFISFVFRWVADLEMTCSRDRRYLCQAASYGLGHIYIFAFTFMLIISASKLKMLFEYTRQVRTRSPMGFMSTMWTQWITCGVKSCSCCQCCAGWTAAGT